MPNNQFQDPYQYVIREGIISHSRNSKIQRIDIGPSIAEMEFYESIDSLGVYGTVTFADTSRVMEIIDFQGTELFELSVAIDSNATPLVRTFRIVNIISGQKTTDHSEVFILSLVDAHSYLNTCTKLARTYTGKPSDIIQTVLNDNFLGEKKLIYNPQRVEIQEAIKYISPHLQPFEVIKLMANRATGPNGTPFYCWGVFADDHLRYGDLHDLLSFPALFENVPLKYNAKFTQDLILNPDEQGLHISHLQYDDQENALKMVKNGNVGATYDYLDTSGGYTNSIFFDIKTMIENTFAGTPGLGGAETSHPNFDTSPIIGGVPIHQTNARQFSSIASTFVYNDYPSYAEDQTSNYHRAKFTQKAMRELLRKSTIKITVPGRRFFPGYKSGNSAHNMTIGNKLNIAISDNASVSDEESAPFKKDQKRSGPYIVLQGKHHFVLDKYSVSMELGKLSSPEGNVALPSVLGTGAR